MASNLVDQRSVDVKVQGVPQGPRDACTCTRSKAAGPLHVQEAVPQIASLEVVDVGAAK